MSWITKVVEFFGYGARLSEVEKKLRELRAEIDDLKRSKPTIALTAPVENDWVLAGGVFWSKGKNLEEMESFCGTHKTPMPRFEEGNFIFVQCPQCQKPQQVDAGLVRSKLGLSR